MTVAELKMFLETEQTVKNENCIFSPPCFIMSNTTCHNFCFTLFYYLTGFHKLNYLTPPINMIAHPKTDFLPGKYI